MKPFRNAPVPPTSPDPESLGIKVDRRTLREALGSNGNDLDNWLLYSFKLSVQGSFLGQTTKYLYRLAYRTGNITDRRVTETCDLHDLVIDSAKNGHIFDQESWDKFRKQPGMWFSLPDSPYEEFMKAAPAGLKDLVDGTSYKRTDARDVVCFEVIGPRYLRLVKSLQEQLGKSKVTDVALEEHWRDAQTDAKEMKGVVKRIVDDLKKDIKSLSNRFTTETAKCFRNDETLDGARYAAVVLECSQMFQQIQPRGSLNEVVRQWIKKFGGAFSRWELIRASAIFTELCALKGHAKTKLAFLVAWYELLSIKVHSGKEQPRMMMKPLYEMQKVRKGRTKLFRGKQVSDSFSEEREDDDLWDLSDLEPDD